MKKLFGLFLALALFLPLSARADIETYTDSYGEEQIQMHHEEITPDGVIIDLYFRAEPDPIVILRTQQANKVSLLYSNGPSMFITEGLYYRTPKALDFLVKWVEILDVIAEDDYYEDGAQIYQLDFNANQSRLLRLIREDKKFVFDVIVRAASWTKTETYYTLEVDKQMREEMREVLKNAEKLK